MAKLLLIHNHNTTSVNIEHFQIVLQCMSQGKPAPELSWQDEHGNPIEAAVNSSSVRHGMDLFRTISDLPLTARRTGTRHRRIVVAISVNTQAYNLPKSCNHPDHYPTALRGGHSSTIVCLAQNFAETKSSSVSLIVHYRYPSNIFNSTS